MVKFNVSVDDDDDVFQDVDVEWCDIWDRVKEKMIPDILDRISKKYPSELKKWFLKKKKLN